MSNLFILSLILASFLIHIFSLFPMQVALAAEGPLVLRRPSPSEFDPRAKETVLIEYYLSKDVKVLTIQVRDFKGAVIREEITEDVRAGPGQWQWDGRDDRGQLVQQGQYQVFITAELPDGRTISDSALVRVVKRPPRPLAPPPLPPPTRPYRIEGETSGFFRRDMDEGENTYEGRFGLHTVYDRRPIKADFNLYLIQREMEETNWDNCYASFSYERKEVKFLAVFRKSLGAFNDPFRLFDDVRTERFKSGARIDLNIGGVALSGLGFGAEGDTNCEEKGYAARVEVPLWGKLSFGSSLVGRFYKASGFEEEVRSVVAGVDGVLNIGRGFTLAAEWAISDDDETDERGMAGRVEVRYNGPRLRAVLGYQDLGENFKADLAYISKGVRSDARGIDFDIDYYPGSVLLLERVGILMRSFYYRRHSNNDGLYEIDGNVRFSIGARDDFMLGLIVHDVDSSEYKSLVARHLHRFGDNWSNELSYSFDTTDGDKGHILREMIHYNKPLNKNVSAGLQWANREASDFDPSCWDELSFLAWGQWLGWFFEIEERLVFANGVDSNFFAKIGYRLEFYRRYLVSFYAAYGDRATRETSNTIEIGAEVRF